MNNSCCKVNFGLGTFYRGGLRAVPSFVIATCVNVGESTALPVHTKPEAICSVSTAMVNHLSMEFLDTYESVLLRQYKILLSFYAILLVQGMC